MTQQYETLVSEIYEVWQLEGSLSKQGILDICNRKEATALLISWLDTQVGNGGLLQWLTSDYAEFLDLTISALMRISKVNGNDSSAALQVANKLHAALGEIDNIGVQYDFEDEHEQVAQDLAEQACQEFDDFYYEGISEALLTETETWLTSA